MRLGGQGHGVETENSPRPQVKAAGAPREAGDPRSWSAHGTQHSQGEHGTQGQPDPAHQLSTRTSHKHRSHPASIILEKRAFRTRDCLPGGHADANLYNSCLRGFLVLRMAWEEGSWPHMGCWPRSAGGPNSTGLKRPHMQHIWTSPGPSCRVHPCPCLSAKPGQAERKCSRW